MCVGGVGVGCGFRGPAMELGMNFFGISLRTSCGDGTISLVSSLTGGI